LAFAVDQGAKPSKASHLTVMLGGAKPDWRLLGKCVSLYLDDTGVSRKCHHGVLKRQCSQRRQAQPLTERRDRAARPRRTTVQ
jgi:hypothetical protein